MMQLVIKLDEKLYTTIKSLPDFMCGTLQTAIKNGVPLPKGHGRLIDERKITKCQEAGLYIIDGNVSKCLITDAPTIIEADRRR